MGSSYVSERLTPGRKYPSWVVQEHLNRYRFASRYVRGKVALDAGCGSGYGSNILIQSGAKLVYGLDNSETSLKYGTTHYKSTQLRFVRHDLATPLPFKDESFDVVVSFETIEHLSNSMEFLRDCHRVLKTGGLVVISTPNKSISSPLTVNNPENPYHAHEFFPDEFLEVVSSVFMDVRCYGQTIPSRIRGPNPLIRFDVDCKPLREFRPKLIDRREVYQAKYATSILIGTRKDKVNPKKVSQIFARWKVRHVLQINENLSSQLSKLQQSDPLSTLLTVYWRRPDLQRAYPEVRGGTYLRLLKWARHVVTSLPNEADFRTLSRHREWYVSAIQRRKSIIPWKSILGIFN